MTVFFTDGFDHGDATDVWTISAGNSDYATIKRTGTHSRSMGINAIQYRALSAAEQDDGVTLGAAAYMGSTNTDATRVMGHRFFEVGGNTHIEVVVYPPARSIRIFRGTWQETLVAESPPNVLTWETWHYIESKVKIADAGGTVEVRLNGSSVLTYAGDTRNAGAGLVTAIGIIGNSFSAQTCLFDDVYMLNEQGAAPYNTFLGDSRSYPLYPMGNGFYLMLVGSDGNSVDNYLLVDEAGVPLSADYVGSVTNGNKDTYLMQNLSDFVTLGTVHAVEVRIYAAKTETGTKKVRPVFRRAGVDAVGADQTVAWNSYATYRELFMLDPTDSSSWTIAKIDALEVGAEVRP